MSDLGRLIRGSTVRPRWVTAAVVLTFGGALPPGAAFGQQPVTLDQAIEQIGGQLARSAQAGRYLRLAVPDMLDLQNATTMLGRYVAERLTTQLSSNATGYSVMERRRVGQALAELNFGAYDLVQAANARRFGQMLGVDAIVVGTLTALTERVDVDVRIVDIESSSILGAARATFLKTADIASLLALVGADSTRAPGAQQAPARAAVEPATSDADRDGVPDGMDRCPNTPMGTPVDASGCPTPPPPAAAEAIEWSDRAVSVRAVSAVRRARETVVTFTVTNVTASTRSMAFHIGDPRESSWNAYLIDDLGNRYSSVAGNMLSGGARSATVNLEPDVPVRFQLTFDAAAPDATSVTMITPAQPGLAGSVRLGRIPLGTESPRAPGAQQAPARAAAEPAASDADRDGVPNGTDRCPATPAGVAVDANGCTLDTDRDGVGDYADRCPNTATRTPVDAAGCPLQRDSDRDGVIDANDRCANTPSTVRVDATGCPLAELPTVDAALVARNISFGAGTAVVLPSSFAELDRIAAAIIATPDSRWEIGGHTDAAGDPAVNQRLSQERAQAVLVSLVERGVPAAALSAVGYGAARPVAPNAFPAGREQNRRIEIKRLQ